MGSGGGGEGPGLLMLNAHLFLQSDTYIWKMIWHKETNLVDSCTPKKYQIILSTLVWQ